MDRILKLSRSDVYAGWTDGRTYIAIDRGRERELTSPAGTRWSTNTATTIPRRTRTRTGAEFFESYHNLAAERIGRFLEVVMREWPQMLQRAGRSFADLAHVQRESNAYSVGESTYEEVAAQLGLFNDLPPHRAALRVRVRPESCTSSASSLSGLLTAAARRNRTILH